MADRVPLLRDTPVSLEALWLSIQLPRLPLEIYAQQDDGHCPRVVGSGQGRGRRVLIADHAAQDLGIQVGMSIGAAYALAKGLQVCPRDEPAETLALEHIAVWCGRFTPTISLLPPTGILLEIAGSLALFGGVEALLKQLREGISDLGYGPLLAVAPTPTAATLCTAVGEQLCIMDRAALVGRLARLPLEALGLPAKTLVKLQGMGLHLIGECLRLPRAGLARRIGPALWLTLDRALGQAPDPRPRFEPPARFQSRLPLPAEVDGVEALLFATRRLLAELTTFLNARCQGVQEMDLRLSHRHGPDTIVGLGLLSPTSDLGHIAALMRERLERVVLPSPVCALSLLAERIVPLPGRTQALFPHHDDGQTEDDWRGLVERLRARLGDSAIVGLRMVADHRPEYAWDTCIVGDQGVCVDPGHRPLWLLARPLALDAPNGTPTFRGQRLTPSHCERIETGWWDGRPVARDYFIAEASDGARYWVYHELGRQKRWFLHGIF